MLYSFRNRRFLVQATIPLARKLANLLSLVKACEDENKCTGDVKAMLVEVLQEIEEQISLNGGTSIAMHASLLHKKLEREGIISLSEVEFLLDELDMQHYHASFAYKRFEDSKEWLTWYKLTPKSNLTNDFVVFLEKLTKSNPAPTKEKLLGLLYSEFSSTSSIYEKLFLSFFIDRLELVIEKGVDAEAINDAMSYLLKQKDFSSIDGRVWSSLLWHAHKHPTEFVTKLKLNEKEDSLDFFAKKEITEEISEEILPYIGKARWPSWTALEGDFISLSELLETDNISWVKVRDHLAHIMSQSLKDDTNWNPGVFLQKMVTYVEKNPKDLKGIKPLFVKRLAMWKDALLKRDPLSVLNWINLALSSKTNWTEWFKKELIIDNKIEQEVIYEIQDDLVNNKNLAKLNIQALELNWLLNAIDSPCADVQLEVIKSGLINEALFWANENSKASQFFAETALNLNVENSGVTYLLNHSALSQNKAVVVEEEPQDEISEELLNAIIQDAESMLVLLQASLNKMFESKVCNNDFMRATHSLKTLSLNIDHEYSASFFAKLESWSVRMVEMTKKLTEKDFEVVFSIGPIANIIVSNWKKKIKVDNLSIENIVKHIDNTFEKDGKASAKKPTISYRELFVHESEIDNEVDAIDMNIFENFKEEALDIFDKLDVLLDGKIKSNIDEINRLLHTLKGGSRISGLLKLGAWVHQIEDITTTKVTHLSDEDLRSALEYAFDKSRNLFSTSVTDFMQENETGEDKEIFLKLPLKEIESIADSLLVSEAAQKKMELYFSNLKELLENYKEPIKRLSFLASEVYVEAEGLLSAGTSRKRKSSGLFDALEMDKFTYFHELTRKLEEAVTDNILYNNLVEKTVYELTDTSKNGKLWLNIAQKELVKNLNNEAKTYESRLKATVRSASKELDKNVEIQFEGSALYVDKKILDEITPALEHLVRNSVAHSIESPEARMSKNKVAVGKVKVKAETSGDWFMFSVSDDGAGINFDKIREKAIEKDLISADDNLSKDELIKVMFSKGFSTASTVSNIAGRGVGLDAVEEMIQKIDGKIEVKFDENDATSFVISVPMSLWLLSGVKAVVNNKTYVISNTQIKEISVIPAKEVQDALNNKFILMNGEKVPCIYLDYINDIFGISKLNNFHSVIHLKNNKCVIVDSVEFVEKQPIKALAHNLYKDKGISGTTILSDSNVGLVIDALSNHWNHLYEENVVISETKHSRNQNLVLVVDDSLTIRRASTKFLTKNGYECVTADNGLEAVKYVESNTLPGIILMDIEMPVMDGFEALQRIKAIEFAKDIPVVIISSRAVDKHINYAKSIGAIDFLGKPFNEEKLLTILEQYVKNRDVV